jgi:hypothetical protein
MVTPLTGHGKSISLPPYLTLCTSSCLFFVIYQQTQGRKIFLTSMSHMMKLIEPEERVVGTLIYGSWVRIKILGHVIGI